MLKYTLISVTIYVAFGLDDSHLNEFVHQRILSGQDAKENEFPYLVSIQYEEDHKCGGSIISASTVLTAAHCINLFPIEDLSVVVGSKSIKSGGIRHYVEYVIPHEKFDEDNYYGDIGLVFLKSALIYSLSVQAIPMAMAETLPGTNVYFSGWGNNVLDGRVQAILQTVTLAVISHKECKIKLPYLLDDANSQICTFTKKGQGVCQGDSGGPLIAHGRQVGLASWGRPCGIGYPDVYTNVSYYVNWIKSHAPKVQIN